MYYNTTNETGEEILKLRAKALTQEDKILDYFHRNIFNTGYSPSEVMRSALPKSPLTSVRRAMTDLTNQGKLVKTNKKRSGIYGRNEYIWKLKGDE